MENYKFRIGDIVYIKKYSKSYYGISHKVLESCFGIPLVIIENFNNETSYRLEYLNKCEYHRYCISNYWIGKDMLMKNLKNNRPLRITLK